jgi:hypothetical protein
LGVTATSIRSTWAVGITGRQAVTSGAALADGAVSDEPAVAASAVAETLILRWNGNAWKRVPSSSPATGSGLLGVVATSARNAWAVGLTGPPFQTNAPNTDPAMERHHLELTPPSPAVTVNGVEKLSLSERNAYSVCSVIHLQDRRRAQINHSGTSVPRPAWELTAITRPGRAIPVFPRGCAVRRRAKRPPGAGLRPEGRSFCAPGPAQGTFGAPPRPTAGQRSSRSL